MFSPLHSTFASCHKVLRTSRVPLLHAPLCVPGESFAAGWSLNPRPHNLTRLVAFAASAPAENRPQQKLASAPTGNRRHHKPGSKQQLGKSAKTAAPSINVNKAKRAPDIKYLHVELPRGDFSRIKKAVFIKSSVAVEDCPKHNLPEFAIIGRSNVGKSSLINFLTSEDKLARVSKSPGLTRCINHFLINDAWYLVDLPGYGYAKQSKTARKEWLEFTKNFFIHRTTLCHVLLLVDAGVPVQLPDVECAHWLGEAQVPFSIVFTKVDKAGRDARNYINDFKVEMMKDWEAIPLCFETSSKTGTGRAQLQQYIAGLHKMWLTSSK